MAKIKEGVVNVFTSFDIRDGFHLGAGAYIGWNLMEAISALFRFAITAIIL